MIRNCYFNYFILKHNPAVRFKSATKKLFFYDIHPASKVAVKCQEKLIFLFYGLSSAIRAKALFQKISTFTKPIQRYKNMATYDIVLKKMQTELLQNVHYYLVFETGYLFMNDLISQTINIKHIGYQCLNCGIEKKIFSQGHCYDCFKTSPSVGDWIMKPELSTAHLDIADRDLAYEKSVQLQPHVVYLSLTSEVKVGVTRKTQIPTRWIDQGAIAAIPIIELPNRYLAGITEVALKNHYADKTSWQKMLKNDYIETDLIAERLKTYDFLPKEVIQFWQEDVKITQLIYPVLNYPQKISSINLDKQPEFSGKLIGIKGQYLIFENGQVWNVRSHEGFKVNFGVN